MGNSPIPGEDKGELGIGNGSPILSSQKTSCINPRGALALADKNPDFTDKSGRKCESPYG